VDSSYYVDRLVDPRPSLLLLMQVMRIRPWPTAGQKAIELYTERVRLLMREAWLLVVVLESARKGPVDRLMDCCC
jgi:hypothetical protein